MGQKPDETVKVVINTRHGGFGLSTEACEWLLENGWTLTEYDDDGGVCDADADLVLNAEGSPMRRLGEKYSLIPMRNEKEVRTDESVIECVRELGDAADGPNADLQIVEIPADVEWTINEYDGAEWIAEEHRTWP